MPLKLEIVTPEKEIFSDEVDTCVLPGIDGEMGVLPSHAPLVTIITPGELSYTKGGETMFLAVGEGFIEVGPEVVSVMTDMAISDELIDEEAVEKALQSARDALEQKSTDEEVAIIEASIAKSLAQLHVKRRRRRL
ncbi:MAG: ATP synthase F1 subunit epsilon [Verrucomicrobiales bacterium]